MQVKPIMVDLRTEDVISQSITFFSIKSNNSFRYVLQNTATDVTYKDQIQIVNL